MNARWLLACGLTVGLVTLSTDNAEACSPPLCIQATTSPGDADPTSTEVPANLPGMILAPIHTVTAAPPDPSAFALIGSDGHRVGLSATTDQPPRDLRGRVVVAFDTPLRAGVTYQLDGPPTEHCSTGTVALGFTTTASSASFPTAAPRLDVSSAQPTDVFTYGSAACYQQHRLPAVRLSLDFGSDWSDVPTSLVSYFVDGQAYSNWSVEQEMSWTPKMNDKIIYARCGVGRASGVEAGPHTAHAVVILPGIGSFTTNTVEFDLDCATLPPDAGVQDSGPSSDAGVQDSGASSDAGVPPATGATTDDETFGCRSSRTDASLVLLALGLLAALVTRRVRPRAAYPSLD